VLWHCWLGDRKGIRLVKKLDIGWLMATVSLKFCMFYSIQLSPPPPSSCFNKTQNGDIMARANPGPPWIWPLKWRQRERERESNCMWGLWCQLLQHCDDLFVASIRSYIKCTGIISSVGVSNCTTIDFDCHYHLMQICIASIVCWS